MHSLPILERAAVRIISDDRAGEDDVSAALEGQGCVISRTSPGLGLDITTSCDIGVITVHRSCGWSAGVITTLRSSEIACATVVVLGGGGPPDIAQALRGGAVDCLVRPIPPAALLESLVNAAACTLRWRRRLALVSDISYGARLANANALLFEPARESTTRGELAPGYIREVVGRLAGEHQLTPREREVLYWMLQGHRHDDIATVLGVVPRTAKFHAANLLRKLEIDSRNDLARLLVRGRD
ncbi:LuxR C-terminal-related transcriptional regulator [Enhygromyxa salina]|uniref:Response regulator FixJ n=1 Tax=Enhygromyxa salina TaxID=215803 RepID=A0A2S9YU34_9BACT|nr:LuxR C-terminal-related transcriptional regulator [Enhygromyxa salina]PRQ08594.1 response regulator FixJ [Enhygromyxa salina]